MIRYSKEFEKKDLILPIALLVAFLNPFIQGLEFTNPIVYMLDHYAIYGAGVLLGYKLLRTNFYLFLLGVIPAGFWHIPLFFALGASFIQYRTIEELTLFLGGLIAGGYIPQMKLSGKVGALAVYMLADSILSIFFILEYKQYTHECFPFLDYTPSQLPFVGISMFAVMNVILVYAIIKILRNASIF
ncbi:DUF1404 domain-containing protein [Acidianus infernus]|uniref:DUF1404 domain-containing protein n=1 Tax=Acidianus infernus TaxID=12915 RepID=A0A6A9QP97_ACIIN|nr:DUF1404 domain-containing protein [Acidianus infernus]MUM65728.1 DUF1404 domain-containing protein [Acidianus infernus]